MVKSSVTVDVVNINVSGYFCEVMKDFYFATSRSQKREFHHPYQHCLKERLFRRELSLLWDYHSMLKNVVAWIRCTCRFNRHSFSKILIISTLPKIAAWWRAVLLLMSRILMSASISVPHWRCLHFVVVVGLEWSDDP